MIKMKLVGEGVFGNFIRDFLNQHDEVEFVLHKQQADFILIAVPYSTYLDVAQQYTGHHLVNMCSTQETTNNICSYYSDRVTGIHPLFGRKANEDDDKVCLVTHRCGESEALCNIFIQLGVKVIHRRPSSILITGEWHDKLMARSHAKVLDILESSRELLSGIEDIPEGFLPISVRKLLVFTRQFSDMPQGTLDSIRANKYLR